MLTTFAVDRPPPRAGKVPGILFKTSKPVTSHFNKGDCVRWYHSEGDLNVLLQDDYEGTPTPCGGFQRSWAVIRI